MTSKEDGSLTATCQVGGHAQCSNIISIPNGGTQGVSQHFLKYHTDLNVWTHSTALWRGGTTILDALNRAVARGDPLMWWNQHVQEFPRLARIAPGCSCHFCIS